jgi:DNA-binding PadR family transcriptional regulator
MMYITVHGGDHVQEDSISSDLLRGHTDTMILRLLMEGDKYGYEITKLVREKSGGEYELKESTMFSGLKRLESGGEVSSYWGDETLGGRRKYYRITEKGKALYAENKNNWERAKRILNNLL